MKVDLAADMAQHGWMRDRRLTLMVLTAILAVPLTAVVPTQAEPVPRLAWTACAGVDHPVLRCAAVRVPLDHAKPGGRSIDVVISRLPAEDPARRHGVLVMTGGGPGNPGVPLPVQWGAVLPATVRATFDLVGFDIRFTERSTPISCGQPAEEPGGYWIRTAGLAPFASHVAQARQYARDCQRHAGWALPYATTANAARDLDLIRSALGERKISYLGGSFAGLLGAYYAALHPDRVDRFVLDSPPFGDAIWRPFELDRARSLEAGFHAFTTFVAAGNETYHLGDTAEAVTSSLYALSDRANTGNLTTPDGHRWTFGEVGYLTLLGTSVDQLFPAVATNLAALAAGTTPPVPLPLYPAALPGTPADSHTAVNTAYRCADHPWPTGLDTYRRDLATYSTRYPTYGPAVANINPCAFWPVRADNRVPLPAGRPPAMLFAAATRDPVVPPRNTLATMAAFSGSRLVTVDAQYHAPIPFQGNECLMTTVAGYLTTGVLPAGDVTCYGVR